MLLASAGPDSEGSQGRGRVHTCSAPTGASPHARHFLYFLEPSQQGWAPGQFVILQTGKQRSQVTREAHTGSEEQARIFIFKFYLFIFTCLKGREGQKDRDLPFTGSLLGQEPGTHSRPTTWVARTLVLEPYLLPPSNWNQEWSWDTNLCPLRWVAGIPSGVLTAIPKAPS